MSLSLYQASIPAFNRGLDNLTALLENAKAPAADNKVALASYVNARLAPDVFTLAGQVQNASEGDAITLKLGDKDSAFNSEPYLLGFVMPNCYFHLTTAYDILRAQGVPLVKMDYLGAFQD
jgi:hypothetical protein